MFEIEYGVDYAEAYIIRSDDWGKAVLGLYADLTDLLDRSYITSEEFVSAVQWVSGVVIDDADVRVPGRFEDGDGFGLSVAITRHSSPE